jgi:hypothetical protein
MTGTPLPFQPPLPPGPPPAHAANLRLLKDQEDLPSDLEALLKEQQEAAAAAEGGAGSAAAPPPVPVPAHLQAVGDAQWIECDVRALDYSLLGKFGVVMVDPPWEEVTETPTPKPLTAMLWDFEWEIAHAAVSRRPPISLSGIVARTGGYTCDAKVWDLCIVQGAFSVAPCHPKVAIRNFSIAV